MTDPKTIVCTIIIVCWSESLNCLSCQLGRLAGPGRKWIERTIRELQDVYVWVQYGAVYHFPSLLSILLCLPTTYNRLVSRRHNCTCLFCPHVSVSHLLYPGDICNVSTCYLIHTDSHFITITVWHILGKTWSGLVSVQRRPWFSSSSTLARLTWLSVVVWVPCVVMFCHYLVITYT